jgi:hypothetical protein
MTLFPFIDIQLINSETIIPKKCIYIYSNVPHFLKKASPFIRILSEKMEKACFFLKKGFFHWQGCLILISGDH